MKFSVAFPVFALNVCSVDILLLSKAFRGFFEASWASSVKIREIFAQNVRRELEPAPMLLDGSHTPGEAEGGMGPCGRISSCGSVSVLSVCMFCWTLDPSIDLKCTDTAYGNGNSGVLEILWDPRNRDLSDVKYRPCFTCDRPLSYKAFEHIGNQNANDVFHSSCCLLFEHLVGMNSSNDPVSYAAKTLFETVYSGTGVMGSALDAEARLYHQLVGNINSKRLNLTISPISLEELSEADQTILAENLYPHSTEELNVYVVKDEVTTVAIELIEEG
ncbi:hypothetical protein L596_024601 [Steinernema carpocapsae]|uniref:Uncharacterized protein n=1 Tax=Steinernema carpocapsae TaxID=34508 RepID=A0A4U5MIF1_STECR|nr:hypothetical protein L596_024601 [Steinernema carpocapsae]